MGRVNRAKSKAPRAKRGSSPRVSKGVVSSPLPLTPLHSDLGKEMWAVISDDQVHGDLLYDGAFGLAKTIGGVVATNAAANRQLAIGNGQ